ncbi:hypothetical protein F5882DRAFT_442766 [Hyaloscypha sp. PMI_1271]|nr:hypothetical protein F5882DRAFT_442766 [Hyaloscypha sp. PMI_1271]
MLPAHGSLSRMFLRTVGSCEGRGLAGVEEVAPSRCMGAHKRTKRRKDEKTKIAPDLSLRASARMPSAKLLVLLVCRRPGSGIGAQIAGSGALPCTTKAPGAHLQSAPAWIVAGSHASGEGLSRGHCLLWDMALWSDSRSCRRRAIGRLTAQGIQYMIQCSTHSMGTSGSELSILPAVSRASGARQPCCKSSKRLPIKCFDSAHTGPVRKTQNEAGARPPWAA